VNKPTLHLEMLKNIKSGLYLVLVVASVVLALGIEFHQRLTGHSFDVTQLAMRSLHHEHLIAGSILIGILFAVKFVASR
jgi:hypothetical protein